MTEHSKVRKQISGKQAELRDLKKEEEGLSKITVQIQDQLNRLKIEEMSIRNEILGSKVRSSKSNSGQLFRDSVEPNNPLTRNTGESRSLIETEVQDSNKTEQVDLVDLDLKIPSTTGGMNRSHSFNGESSSEEDEANECLLKI